MIRAFFIALFFLPLAAFGQNFSGEVFDQLERQQIADFEQKIKFWTGQFIGKPYGKNGPLGEGPHGQFDQDPLYRFDTFDCTTFVETITALARAYDRWDFQILMKDIRYHSGVVSYETRNHIISQTWIPSNAAKGYYQDFTGRFPHEMQRQATALIDIGNWYANHTVDRIKVPAASASEKELLLQRLKSIGSNYSPHNVSLNYLDIKELLADWNSFKQGPNGVFVLNIVRPNWDLRPYIGTRLNISHQGILIKNENEISFIHASSKGQVAKIALKDYLEQIKDVPTIKGINLLKILPY